MGAVACPPCLGLGSIGSDRCLCKYDMGGQRRSACTISFYLLGILNLPGKEMSAPL